MDSNKALYGLSEIVVVPACVLLVTGLITGVLVLLGWMAPGKAMMATGGLFFAGLILTQIFRQSYDIREVRRQNRHIIASRTMPEQTGPKESKQMNALLEQGKDLQQAIMLLRNRIGEIEESLSQRQETVPQPETPTRFSVPPARPLVTSVASNQPPEPAPQLPTQKAIPPAPIAATSPHAPLKKELPLPPPRVKRDDIEVELKVEPEVSKFPDPPAPPKQDISPSMGENTLTMHLQPIVSLADSEPVLFDALMRLQKSSGAYFDDIEFEKIAEADGSGR